MAPWMGHCRGPNGAPPLAPAGLEGLRRCRWDQALAGRPRPTPAIRQQRNFSLSLRGYGAIPPVLGADLGQGRGRLRPDRPRQATVPLQKVIG